MAIRDRAPLLAIVYVSGMLVGCPQPMGELPGPVSPPEKMATATGTLRLNANANGLLVAEMDDDQAGTRLKVFGTPRTAAGQFWILGVGVEDRTSGEWLLMTGFRDGRFHYVVAHNGATPQRATASPVPASVVAANSRLLAYMRGEVTETSLSDSLVAVHAGLFATLPDKLAHLEAAVNEVHAGILATHGASAKASNRSLTGVEEFLVVAALAGGAIWLLEEYAPPNSPYRSMSDKVKTLLDLKPTLQKVIGESNVAPSSLPGPAFGLPFDPIASFQRQQQLYGNVVAAQDKVRSCFLEPCIYAALNEWRDIQAELIELQTSAFEGAFPDLAAQLPTIPTEITLPEGEGLPEMTVTIDDIFHRTIDVPGQEPKVPPFGERPPDDVAPTEPSEPAYYERDSGYSGKLWDRNDWERAENGEPVRESRPRVYVGNEPANSQLAKLRNAPR